LATRSAAVSIRSGHDVPWATLYDVDVDGDSEQVAVGNTVTGDLVQQQVTFVRGQPPMYLSSAEVSDRVAYHVPGPNHDLVVKELRQNHAAGLLGPPGSGRATTAIAAMRQLRPGLPIRWFSLEEEDSAEIHITDSCGYLVHAGDRGINRLGSCIEAVRDSGGYLAVLAGREAQQQPDALLSWITVESPQPVQVYRRWVSRHGLAGWADWDRAAALLEGALPAEARRLADLAARAAGRGGDPAAMQEEVAHAYLRWEEELRNWFSQHQQPHDRALLIAAATLPPGATEAYVYAAASSLAQRMSIELNGAGLAWCPATGLRELLEADRDDNLIVFRRIGYAESALRHALADYPLARRELLSWLAALPTGEAAACKMGNTVAQTFADLAAEHGEAERITSTARTWGQDDLADLAFIALSRTCLHPHVGGQVRRALYDWSRTASTPQTLKLTIARVCQPLGQTYPSIALTRLKHLATYSDSKVAGEVIDVARALADQGHRQEVLKAALAWCADAAQEHLSERARRRRRKVGAMLFMELATPLTPAGLPEVLAGKYAVRPASFVLGWRAIFDLHGTPGLWNRAIEKVMCRWLDAALHHPHIRERISAIIVVAARPPAPFGVVGGIGSAEPNPASAEVVIGIVQRWAASSPADPIRTRLRDEIVIPLTRPIWRRLLRILSAKLRPLGHNRSTKTTSK
jgi:hypothetical protein